MFALYIAIVALVAAAGLGAGWIAEMIKFVLEDEVDLEDA